MLKIFEKLSAESRAQREYEDGFAWACVEHLHRQVELRVLRSKVSPEFFTAFDRGANDALRVFECNQAALEAANHNFAVANKEVAEVRQSVQTLHKKCQDLERSLSQCRAENKQYRIALAGIQTKCKNVLNPLPNLVHEPEYSFNDEYNQVRSEADDCAS